MPAQDWVPPDVDMTTPSVARVYDYLLGGSHNFAVDRTTAAHLAQVEPHAGSIVRIHRAFLARVVRYLVGQGIRQFLDIGSGIPTVGNVHEIAQRIDPACRVVYVDRDPVAVAHSELLLTRTSGTGVVHADMRDPDTIFASAPVRQHLDFSQPVGLLFMLMLHWVPGDAGALVRRYRERLCSGSHLSLSHVVYDKHQQYMDEMVSVMQESQSADQLNPRNYEEIESFFGDFELVEPGLVGCAEWRPAGPGDIVEIPLLNEYVHGGVARKP